jgi:hypothetical protein
VRWLAQDCFCVMELPRSKLWGVGVDPIQ